MVTCVWGKTSGHLCMGQNMVTCVGEKTWSPVYGKRNGHLRMGEDMVTCVWGKTCLP
jgi:hypothetical protein